MKYLLSLFSLLISQLSLAKPPETDHETCGNNSQAEALITLIKTHTGQQREQLHCNPKLNEIARIKADHLITEQHIWHDVGNLTPNQLLRHNGFDLPHSYPLFGNQVEALAGGEISAADAFQSFLNSEPHKKLLLGEENLFKQQDQIGVAYLSDLTTDHQHYWVVIIADQKPEPVVVTHVAAAEAPEVERKKRNRGREIKQRMYSRQAKRQTGLSGLK